MLSAMLAPFAWKTMFQAGAWLYKVNRVTGERKAVYSGSGHSPKDERWLAGEGDVGLPTRPAQMPNYPGRPVALIVPPTRMMSSDGRFLYFKYRLDSEG